MFITRYGSTQYRMFIDRRVISLSESTYNVLKDGGVQVKLLSNAAVDALASICENYLKVDASPTAGTEDAYLVGILNQVDALLKQEADRYKVYYGNLKAILAAVAADDTNDVTEADVEKILDQVAAVDGKVAALTTAEAADHPKG